jgi:tRNA threonylcarbamoyl adenosine modification protein YeaZ
MIILALDMSGDCCSIAIGDEKNILAQSSVFARMRHLPKVMPQIDFTLKQANKKIEDIELLCTVAGPGSWTGIRIAITMTKVFAHTLSIPCVTVGSLKSMAYNLRFVSSAVYPIIDASRKQVYFAGFNCQEDVLKTINKPSLKKIDVFLDHITSPAILLGNGCVSYGDLIRQYSTKKLIIAPESMNQINIGHVIEIGYEKFLTKGPDDVHGLSPVYLQQTDAERNFEKK